MITAKAAEDLANNATVAFSFVSLEATTGGTNTLGTVMGENELTVTFRRAAIRGQILILILIHSALLSG